MFWGFLKTVHFLFMANLFPFQGLVWSNLGFVIPLGITFFLSELYRCILHFVADLSTEMLFLGSKFLFSGFLMGNALAKDAYGRPPDLPQDNFFKFETCSCKGKKIVPERKMCENLLQICLLCNKC